MLLYRDSGVGVIWEMRDVSMVLGRGEVGDNDFCVALKLGLMFSGIYLS